MGWPIGGPPMRSPADRWRLMLGRFAARQLGDPEGLDARRDSALDFLYGREYAKRGLRPARGAGLDPTQMRALDWLHEAEMLFPQPVFEALRAEGLQRYDLTDLLSDPKTLENLEASPSLLRCLLGLQGRADVSLKGQLRQIARRVIDDITARLRAQVVQSLSGRRNRHQRSPVPSSANFDALRTVRANLGHWDADRQALVAERLAFFSRQRRQLDWTVILCVDQSGSMTDSLIFSAVMAAILAGLPGITVRMVLFDTSVVDVTDQLADPLELLLSVQLGGGTDIGKAVSYCETLIDNPSRTVLALVSDFYEGAGPRRLLATVARLNAARVKMLGIAALDDSGKAAFDRDMVEKLASLGMNVAALTPDAFAEWLAGVMN